MTMTVFARSTTHYKKIQSKNKAIKSINKSGALHNYVKHHSWNYPRNYYDPGAIRLKQNVNIVPFDFIPHVLP